VKLLDASLLLHAYDPDFQRHQQSSRWLEKTFSDPELVGLAWVAILAFLRISTNPRAFRRPFSVEEATRIVSEWLGRPNAVILEPGLRHWEILSGILSTAQARGDLVTDAHLASLAIEHGAVLCTDDRDFARFPGLRTLDPLES
jgi:toxin-antitoxin system PIN domain toxin